MLDLPAKVVQNFRDAQSNFFKLAEQFPVGGSGNLFVQPTNPGMTEPGLWIQTEIGADNDMTFWVEDGT